MCSDMIIPCIEECFSHCYRNEEQYLSVHRNLTSSKFVKDVSRQLRAGVLTEEQRKDPATSPKQRCFFPGSRKIAFTPSELRENRQ